MRSTSFLAIAALLNSVNADVSFSTTECSDNCCPAKCSMVSNEPCSFPVETIDVQDQIEQMGCKVCTQSTDSTCSTSQLQSDYVTSQFHALYCNDEYLVAWTNGLPAHVHGLNGIDRPPGSGEGGGYGEQCVVRTAGVQMQIYKFPLTKPTLSAYVFATNTENNLGGASGMAKDGTPIYPYQNDRGESAWDSCELDYCNAHAGKGEDYHLHGDPFGSKCLYDSSDYSGNHPPTVGMGADGYPIHGRYTQSGQDGITTDLDGCNGHSHGFFGYHYHANQVQVIDGSDSWTEYRIGPTQCWGGDINEISNFWSAQSAGKTLKQINYDVSKTNPKYCPVKRNDYDQIKPCCGSTNYVVASGISLNLVDGTCASSNGCASSGQYYCPGSTSSTVSTDEDGAQYLYKGAAAMAVLLASFHF